MTARIIRVSTISASMSALIIECPVHGWSRLVHMRAGTDTGFAPWQSLYHRIRPTWSLSHGNPAEWRNWSGLTVPYGSESIRHVSGGDAYKVSAYADRH